MQNNISAYLQKNDHIITYQEFTTLQSNPLVWSWTLLHDNYYTLEYENKYGQIVDKTIQVIS